MAALGELSGGLAHELNNALLPIMGLSGIAKERLRDRDRQLYEYMEIMENSALHARSGLQKVLSFSRSKTEPGHMSLQELLETIDFTRSILPASVQVTIDIPPDIQETEHAFLCDKTSLSQILMNLLRNAADSMESSGAIAIRAEKRPLNQEEKPCVSKPGGLFFILHIADEGCGMDAKTIANIFDPFYTTKEEGKGTGLGLSTVYSILKSYDGGIRVQSEPGQGSTFSLLFPVVSLNEKPENSGLIKENLI